jgi:urocanate hydratase
MRTGKGYYADDQDNLDYAVAQHPELITYGGNGAVFKTGHNTY